MYIPLHCTTPAQPSPSLSHHISPLNVPRPPLISSPPFLSRPSRTLEAKQPPPRPSRWSRFNRLTRGAHPSHGSLQPICRHHYHGLLRRTMRCGRGTLIPAVRDSAAGLLAQIGFRLGVEGFVGGGWGGRGFWESWRRRVLERGSLRGGGGHGVWGTGAASASLCGS